MKIRTRIAAAAGTVAVAAAGLTFIGAGTASASTWYGVVEQSQSGGCGAYLYGQKTDSGAYQVVAVTEPSGLLPYNPVCAMWVDQSWNGGSTWKGLIGYERWGYGGGNNIGWMDDSSTVIRVCVQEDGDNTARCSGWW